MLSKYSIRHDSCNMHLSPNKENCNKNSSRSKRRFNYSANSSTSHSIQIISIINKKVSSNKKGGEREREKKIKTERKNNEREIPISTEKLSGSVAN